MIEIKKAIKDTEVLKNKLLAFCEKDKSLYIVKLSAISVLFSAHVVGYYFESGKNLDLLIESMFSSIKSDIMRAVDAIESGKSA